MFFVLETFFILKCACLGPSKYFILHLKLCFPAICNMENCKKKLSTRLNHSGLSDDAKTSTFSFYTFSRYTIEKLIGSLSFTTTVSRLIKILESESQVAMDWFKKNKMAVNLDKFQGAVLDK